MPSPVVGLIGATVGSTAVGAMSANKAAKAQQESAEQQVALQREVFNQQKNWFAPNRLAGYRAGNAYMSELGLGARPKGYEGFQKTPGYEFRLKEGQDAVQAGVGARHGLNSGATLKALTEHNQNYASNEYGKHLNRLAGVMQQGQASAAMTATAGNNYATGAGNALANYGDAAAAGAIGAGNAIQGGINNGLSAWMYGKGAGMF